MASGRVPRTRIFLRYSTHPPTSFSSFFLLFFFVFSDPRRNSLLLRLCPVLLRSTDEMMSLDILRREFIGVFVFVKRLPWNAFGLFTLFYKPSCSLSLRVLQPRTGHTISSVITKEYPLGSLYCPLSRASPLLPLFAFLSLSLSFLRVFLSSLEKDAVFWVRIEKAFVRNTPTP